VYGRGRSDTNFSPLDSVVVTPRATPLATPRATPDATPHATPPPSRAEPVEAPDVKVDVPLAAAARPARRATGFSRPAARERAPPPTLQPQAKDGVASPPQAEEQVVAANLAESRQDSSGSSLRVGDDDDDETAPNAADAAAVAQRAFVATEEARVRSAEEEEATFGVQRAFVQSHEEAVTAAWPGVAAYVADESGDTSTMTRHRMTRH